MSEELVLERVSNASSEPHVGVCGGTRTEQFQLAAYLISNMQYDVPIVVTDKPGMWNLFRPYVYCHDQIAVIEQRLKQVPSEVRILLVLDHAQRAVHLQKLASFSIVIMDSPVGSVVFPTVKQWWLSPKLSPRHFELYGSTMDPEKLSKILSVLGTRTSVPFVDVEMKSYWRF